MHEIGEVRVTEVEVKAEIVSDAVETRDQLAVV